MKSMKKKGIASLVIIMLLIVSGIGYQYFTKKDRFFYLPNGIDKVEVISSNGSLPPKYAKDTQKIYTSQAEITGFEQIFQQLELGNIENDRLVGGTTRSIIFYRKNKKVKVYNFYSDRVVKDGEEYRFDSKSLYDFLSEIEESSAS